MTTNSATTIAKNINITTINKLSFYIIKLKTNIIAK